ncbi:6-bladed beta-propeller [Roseivirga misakiensis]|uniref:6-bladed beta-propeller n=1 Tax=Roseivirga misakiensis TaxID=1563681 RepID=A0A1E5T0A6_9BACT|nr:6-bladed beta-propeller [Roseivirga misakiensis]OEK04803.1 hypothetical protein BFP71_15275 [Roseivirga misakiensis]
MISRNKILILFTGFAFLLSCERTEKESVTEPTNIDEFRSYPLDIDVPSRSGFDLIEGIEVLGLEETDESLLEGLIDASFTNGQIIFKNGRKEQVFIYDENGKFISKIEQSGGGPEEYTTIRNLWVNKDLIQIYDGRRIISFNLDGTFASAATFKNRVAHAHSIENGYVGDVSRSPVDGDLNYYLELLNNNLERETLAIPYAKLKQTNMFWLLTPFSKYNDHLVYQHTNGDTLYKVQANGVSPLLSIDLGDKWVWKDLAVYDDLKRQSLLRRENGAVSMFFMRASEQFIYVNAIRSGTFLINRSTGDYQKISFDKKGEGRFGLSYINWVDGKMVYWISSADIGEFLNELDPEKVKFLGGKNLEAIESSENPVLIWVEFKTDLQ